MSATARIKVLVLEETEVGPTTSISHLFGDPKVFDLCLHDDKQRALAEVLTFQPHVVVADYLNPQVDGGWLCREIRRLPGANPIVVLASNYRRVDQLETIEARALALGADALMPRPLTRERAAKIICGLMAGRISRGAKGCYTADVMRAASSS